MNSDNHETDREGWLAVERAFGEMVEEVSAIADTVTRSIRHAQPVYAVIPEHEHCAAVALQVLNRLHALSEHRGLSPAELAAATDLAAERASGGVPIDALIAAYQAADAEIWRILVERATPSMTPLLPRIGSLMFEAIRETTSVMAGAHSRVARAIDGDRITLAHQFLECLDDPGQQSAASVIAARLRLDPQGDFVGLVWLPTPEPAGPGGQRAAATLPSHLAADVVGRTVAGGQLEMVTQVARLVEVVTQAPPEGQLAGRWGIGLPRRGFIGAGVSLGDARLAFNCTSAQNPVRTFARDWHEAILLAERARIDALVTPAVSVARANPHLAETVTAFAEADMSIAATASAVQLHANSITYRLERWSQLTGIDARSFVGLSQAVIACRLARDV